MANEGQLIMSPSGQWVLDHSWLAGWDRTQAYRSFTEKRPGGEDKRMSRICIPLCLPLYIQESGFQDWIELNQEMADCDCGTYWYLGGYPGQWRVTWNGNLYAKHFSTDSWIILAKDVSKKEAVNWCDMVFENSHNIFHSDLECLAGLIWADRLMKYIICQLPRQR